MAERNTGGHIAGQYGRANRARSQPDVRSAKDRRASLIDKIREALEAFNILIRWETDRRPAPARKECLAE